MDTQDIIKILDGAVATGGVNAQLVENFQHLMLSIDMDDTPTMTLKVQGSIADAEPVWTDASSKTNQWSYIQIKDLADASTVNGATGVASSGTAVSRLFEVNVNGLKWLNVIVTAYTAGKAYAFMKPFNTL